MSKMFGGIPPGHPRLGLDDDGARAVHKLFFALYPDPETASRMSRLAEGLRRRHGLTGRPTSPERLHVSLNFIGESEGPPPSGLAAQLVKAAAQVSVRPFRVGLDHIVSWKGAPRPLVLTGEDGVIGVLNLHAALHAALRDTGLAKGVEPAFTPHLTLLRDVAEPPEAFVEPICWTAQAFVLIDSVARERRHTLLGRWPLDAQPPANLDLSSWASRGAAPPISLSK